ncbi:MAG: serine/threonine-protein kinase [Phycisphaerae bacterium]|nr:serine/threonine-protein kinase [Phycisphaerae bacterium]
MEKDPVFGVNPKHLNRLLSLGTEADEPESPDGGSPPVIEAPNHGGPTLAVTDRFEWTGGHIGPYRLREVLGEGGMGVVYLAQQESPIKRRVAIKVIKPGMDTRQVIARFEAERQVLALMDHPNIAQVHDAGATDGGRPYFVMELVAGVKITEHCDRHKLTIDERLRLFVQVCQAVHHAHQKGIIHRDIKPSNILVSVKDGKAIPKIIDFGVAKALNQSLAQSMTEHTLYTEQGQFIGTPEYMSPEQAELTIEDIDTRSDIYALGAVLYELLTGTLPFDSETLREGGMEHIRQVIRDQDPKTPSTRVSGLGEQATLIARQRSTEVGSLARRLRRELEWIPLKAMRKARDRRYRSASELADDIENYLQGNPLIAGPESTLYRVNKFVKRNRMFVGSAAAVTLVLVAGIVVSTCLAIGQARARGEAQAVSEFLQYSLESMNLYRVGGKEVTARSVLERASQVLESQFTGKPLAEAQIRKTFGYTYWSHNEYTLAEVHFRRALDLYRTHAGVQDPVTLEMMRDVAWMCYFHGRFDEAATLFSHALQGAQRALGPDHVTTLSTMTSLAHVYFAEGRFAEAVPLADRAMEAVWRCLDGTEIADEVTRVASGYTLAGHYTQAEDLFIRSLDVCRRTLDPNDYRTLNFKRDYGELCTILGRYDEAESLLLAGLAGRSKVWPQLDEILPNQAALAELYHAQGRYDQAEALFTETLARSRQELGEVNLQTPRCMAGLGALHLDQGRYEEAESILTKTLDIGIPAVGESHWGVLGTMNSLGRLYSAQGRIEQAEAMLTGARETGRRVLGQDHPIPLTSTHQLGVVYMRQARHEDAEPLLLEAYYGRKAKLGPAHPATLESRNQLTELYTAWDRPDEARKWRATQ